VRADMPTPKHFSPRRTPLRRKTRNPGSAGRSAPSSERGPMLASLTVRDVVLIERAELNFAAGLNVLTGETGAGQSIRLEPLGLPAGERGQGRASLRPGADQAAVVAVFEPAAHHPAREI